MRAYAKMRVHGVNRVPRAPIYSAGLMPNGVCELYSGGIDLTLSRARVFIARQSPGHAFLPSFNRNTARKRYPYCQGYNGFWSVVHVHHVEYAQIRHVRHSVISSCRTTVVHERGSLAIIDRFPPGPAFTWS